MKRLIICSVLLTTIVGAHCSAFAQFNPVSADSGGGTVAGAGMVEISRQPEKMRLEIELLAKASDLKQALAALKDRIEAARLQSVALGAIKDSIKIGDPQITKSATDQQQRRVQMQMLMLERMRRGGAGKKSEQAKTPSPVMLSARLTAEWKIDAKNVEELLLFSHSLQQRIEDADLAGTKEAQTLSPEEEELLAESEESLSYMSDDESKPGEPTFLLVSRISDEERDKARAEAFQKAKVQASRLAKAAGLDIGDLKSLTGEEQPGGDEDSYDLFGGYNRAAYRIFQSVVAAAQAGTSENVEAVAPVPGKVRYRITVTAAFELRK